MSITIKPFFSQSRDFWEPFFNSLPREAQQFESNTDRFFEI